MVSKPGDISYFRLIMGKLRYHAQGVAPAKVAVGQSLKMGKYIPFCQIPRRNKLTKSCGALACTTGLGCLRSTLCSFGALFVCAGTGGLEKS